MQAQASNLPRRLPEFTYKGQVFTVDWRLREFRHLIYGETPEYVPFQSKRGRELMRAFKRGETLKIEVTESEAVALGEAIDIVLESDLMGDAKEAASLREVSKKLVLAGKEW